jgi:nucleoside 2-deoxyribosyltransferase
LNGEIIYITGPMTGYKDDNRPAFRDAAKKLRKHGAKVISPDELDELDPVKGEKTWESYLARDIKHLSEATMGVALPGWKHSRGSLFEIFILKTLGKPVLDLRTGKPIPHADIPPLTLPPKDDNA